MICDFCGSDSLNWGEREKISDILCKKNSNKINKKTKEWLLMHHEDGAKQLFLYATQKFEERMISEETYDKFMNEVDMIHDAIKFVKSLEVE